VKRIFALIAILLAAAPAFASEGPGEAAGFIGIPTLVWKILNFIVYFGLLVYLLRKPLANVFGSRREGIARALSEARQQQDEALRMKAEMNARVASLEREIVELKERMTREGERERAALVSQGAAEAERASSRLGVEADRRLAAARVSLAREAADVAAELAWDLLKREVTPEDRERIFAATLTRLEGSAR